MGAKALGFALGESSSHGIVETLALVMAMEAWGPRIGDLSVTINILSDSVTALAMTQRQPGASAPFNFLKPVMGLLLESYRVEEAHLQHVPGAANTVADWLSRPSTWKTYPKRPR